MPNNIDTSDFSYLKYAATYFGGGATAQHERKHLKKSLLKHEHPIDEMASKVSPWKVSTYKSIIYI